MFSALILFQLKQRQRQMWTLCAAGAFTLLSLFFAGILGIKSAPAISLVLMLSSFQSAWSPLQEDLRDGSLALISHSRVTLESYYGIHLFIHSLVDYIMHGLCIALGSVFLEGGEGVVGRSLLLWAPVAFMLQALRQMLGLIALQKSMAYLTALPLAIPALLFFQGALEGDASSVEMLYGLCGALTALYAFAGAKLLCWCVREDQAF